jgi:hypothetical protein
MLDVRMASKNWIFLRVMNYVCQIIITEATILRTLQAKSYRQYVQVTIRNVRDY